MTRVVVFLACAVGLASPGGAQTTAAQVDVGGKWNVSFTTPDGPRPAQLTLKNEAGKLTGTLSSPEGEASVTGTMKGKALALTFTFNGQNGMMEMAMSGAIDGDAMTGTLDHGQGVIDWTAKRAAEDKPAGKTDSSGTGAPKPPETKTAIDVAGSWTFSITTSAVSATPTITFKQDGETLTGQYTSPQYGQFPLTGTIKGGAIAFTFTMNIDGTPINVSYAGTADKDSMQGTMNYGDMMDGTFTAKRNK